MTELTDYKLRAIVKYKGQRGANAIETIELEKVTKGDEVIGYALYLHGIMMLAHVLRSSVEGKAAEHGLQGVLRGRGFDRGVIRYVEELDKDKLIQDRI